MIQRKAYLKRGAPPKRSRIKKKARSEKRSLEHQRAFGGETRLAWIKAQPCLVVSCTARPSENCHVRTGGTGRRADAKWIVPACKGHHAEMHRGQKSFERLYGVDLQALAAQYDQTFRELAAGPSSTENA